jgi:hypothetical protein
VNEFNVLTPRGDRHRVGLLENERIDLDVERPQLQGHGLGQGLDGRTRIVTLLPAIMNTVSILTGVKHGMRQDVPTLRLAGHINDRASAGALHARATEDFTEFSAPIPMSINQTRVKQAYYRLQFKSDPTADKNVRID